MIDGPFQLGRRAVTAGLGATVLRPSLGFGQPVMTHRSMLTLRAGPSALALRSGQPDPGVWGLMFDAPGSAPAFGRGDEVAISFRNELPAPAVVNWRGLDGNPGAEPLTARHPVAPGGSENFVVVFSHAGTLLCCARLLEDDRTRPCATCALVIRESEPVRIDRDEVLLIEDWRLGADGLAAAPGTEADSTAPIYTVNGKAAPDIVIGHHQRARLRFINGCQRNVIAVKIDHPEVHVMAIDSQPAEPFLARDGRIILAPGSRTDVFVDAAGSDAMSPIVLHDGTGPQPIARLLTAAAMPLHSGPLPPPDPLPSNGLPAKLNLRSAQRIELPLYESSARAANWITPRNFTAARPAFRVKRGRTVVASLVNHGIAPVTFHLHGHHFRLLDRLDDGWKPFWLDTLAVDAQQTQRIAFLAQHPGIWLMESMAAAWTAPRLALLYEIV